jgi:2-phospho-L-lactate guanylyltransferase
MPAIIAIVPLKRLSEAKSRLAIALLPEERSWLVRRMFDNVLCSLSGHVERGDVLVVTADHSVQAACAREGYGVLPESENSLNRAIQGALRHAQAQRASQALVLAADLPFVRETDIAALIAASRAQQSPGIVLARAHDGRGSNGLLIDLPSHFVPSFGPDSALRHCEQARRLGVPIATLDVPGLATDIDLPEDLPRLAAHPSYRALLPAIERCNGMRPAALIHYGS